MKKIVEVTEVSGEGLEALLEEPSIVYETGAFSSKQYIDVQRLHCDKWYVQRAAIESFGVAK